MAILNLAGNFQPNSISSGRSLPQETKRAPSTSIGSQDIPVTVAELNPVTENEPSPAVANVKQEDVENQIEQLQQFNQNISRSLQFEVDDELGVTIVRVIDKETDELIRQFPPEELLNLSRRLKELNEQNTSIRGVLLQEKV
jgi:flagellar protein FlaG